MTQLIVEHPLYPLLQMVFHKCELATCSPRDAQTETVCSSDSFSEDIRNFINEARLHNLPLTTGSDDVDKFMLKSIEVLRIHLLELEKVHQLCDSFCSRYINCLKGKLPIDLVVDESSARNGNPQDGSSSNSNNDSSCTNNSSNNLSAAAAQNGQPNTNNSNPNNSNTSNNDNSTQSSNDRTRNSSSASHHQNSNNHHHQQHHQHHLHQHPQAQQQLQQSHHQDASSLAATGPNGYPATDPYHQAAVASSYGYSSNPYAAYHAATSSNNHTTANSNANNNNGSNHRDLTGSSGSSSASSIKVEHGANGGQFGADRQQLHDEVRSPTGSTGSFLGDASLGSGDGTECEDDDNRGKRQQKKRGIFPKAATNIMRAWLFQHLNHPYPSEDQKKQLAEETGLTILQVNNWFINARRRIVQPMIDQSNRTSGNIMAGPAYSPDAASMGYMLDSSQTFRSLPGVESAGMGPLASHAAMTSAMGAYSAASAQHLSQHYGRQQQQHAAMALGLSTPTTGPHSMMGDHSALPPPYYH